MAVADARVVVLKIASIDETSTIFQCTWGNGQRVRVIYGRVGCVREIPPGDPGHRRHVAWGTGVIVHVLDRLDTVAAASYEVCAARYVSYGSIEGEWKSSNLLLVQARVQD